MAVSVMWGRTSFRTVCPLLGSDLQNGLSWRVDSVFFNVAKVISKKEKSTTTRRNAFPPPGRTEF